nr:hypothetical protein [Tanacetum cinerariifolium]
MEGVITEMHITTVEEKAQRRLKVKARSTLRMGIPNEYRLKFNSIKDAKKLMETIEKRFADLDTMSMNDLYNNLKVHEPEVKGMSSSSSSTQNMAFVSSLNNNTSSTNEAVNTAQAVTLLMEFLLLALNQPNSPQLIHKDLQQIYPDDMEEMDLRWKIAMLTLRARRSVLVEISTFIALVSCDDLGGYDWSDQAEEWPNYALMAFLSSSSDSKIVDNCKKGLGYANYNAVSPPYTGNFMPPPPDLSFTILDEFLNESVVENCKAMSSEEESKGNPQIDLQDQGVIDSGCSRHVTRNMSYLTDYEEIDGGYVAFEGNPKGGKITGKGTIKTSNLDFENVYFVREFKFNLFSVSQMCKKDSVLFNDTGCIVLSPNLKLINESQVLLRVPRKNNMYSVDLKNIVPKEGLTCLFTKATSDESKLWHRRLCLLNFKTMNKLVKRNLVRGLPSKLFKNDQTCVACQKGKQHRASCKSKIENSISLPLHLLHMNLFGPTFVKSLKKKMYCLVVTYDYSRFTWVFFLAIKNETGGILKSFITRIENLVDHKVKRNKTLIEAARTMLADSKLSTTFLKEAVSTACYVQNQVLVVTRHNKTPYELFHGKTSTLSFMRPFRCPVTILNTIDYLGKFDGKADEGFIVGYSLNSKAFRVFNSRTRIVKENLHIRFSESRPNIVGSEPDWLFDIDALTRTMNYEPIVAGTKASDNRGQVRKETEPVNDYILLPLWTADPSFSQDPKSSHIDGSKPLSDEGNKVDEDSRKESECKDQEKEDNVNSTNNVNTAGNVNTVSSTVNVAGTNKVNAVGGKISIKLPFDPKMPALEDDSRFDFSSDDEDDGAVADMNNLDTTIQVSPIPTTRIHKDHPLDQVIGDLQSAIQTRKMSENLEEHGFNDLCIAFERLMHAKFQMSSIGELTFFLGLQVKQKKDGIFISQDKYVAELLNKFRFTEVKTVSTSMETLKPPLKNEDGEEVDVNMYRSMICSLMYLTSS